jgi:hypothetical protein
MPASSPPWLARPRLALAACLGAGFWPGAFDASCRLRACRRVRSRAPSVIVTATIVPGSAAPFGSSTRPSTSGASAQVRRDEALRFGVVAVDEHRQRRADERLVERAHHVALQLHQFATRACATSSGTWSGMSCAGVSSSLRVREHAEALEAVALRPVPSPPGSRPRSRRGTRRSACCARRCRAPRRAAGRGCRAPARPRPRASSPSASAS